MRRRGRRRVYHGRYRRHVDLLRVISAACPGRTPRPAASAAPQEAITDHVPIGHRRAPLHLAVALEGAGWHPAARYDPGARPGDPSTARYWTDLVDSAERGLLDLVTVGDAPGSRNHALRVAGLVAASTRRIGLVPTLSATDPAPLPLAAALAALDHDSLGRAGWLLRTPADDVRLPGDRRLGTPGERARHAERLDEAAEAVATVRGLWSTSDGGPVDRPPQGQPPVLAAGRGWDTFRLAARAADVVLTTPVDAFGAAAIVEQVREVERDAGRTGPALRVLADVVVLLEDTDVAARERLDRLDAHAPLYTDAAVVATTPSALADMLLAWQPSGLDGYRLRPARLPSDLDGITGELVPELQRRGGFRTAYGGTTLRDHLGLASRLRPEQLRAGESRPEQPRARESRAVQSRSQVRASAAS